MNTILVVSIVIVFVVLLLAVLTTSKAYSYKHTVDPVDNNPNIKNENSEETNK
ncbi:YtzI protein [Neobacillus massiliamazoniensis]|uniref:Tumor necrosis factor receptor superfamily member 19 n=1 Tax=Neobacillus massiliamazoniensis TaxID=1499688 RepID=A0A0U1P2U5_9BACI|nr:YtzI protein [Neobacillus massiliamazoniensis]CRK84503.1 tumor necrosis factor receptor superfamily member 19 [Neobacillus massiliamazoniensis]